MNLNLTKPVIAALILVILVMAFGWLRSCEKAKEIVQEDDHTTLMQENARLTGQINDSTVRIAQLKSERVSERLKFARVLSGLNASVVHWKGEARKNRPEVIVLADSIPVLKAYILATDSVIAVQDSVIAVQGGHIIAQQKLYELEIAAMGERHVKQQQLTEVWKTAAVSREKDLKRLERKKRFFRTTTLILGGAVAVLILAK